MRIVLNVGVIVLILTAMVMACFPDHMVWALYLLGMAIFGQAIINEDKLDRILKEIE